MNARIKVHINENYKHCKMKKQNAQTSISELTSLRDQVKTPEIFCKTAKIYDLKYKKSFSQTCKNETLNVNEAIIAKRFLMKLIRKIKNWNWKRAFGIIYQIGKYYAGV